MEYIKARGIRYANELPTIRKKKDAPLQPVFEAFTNAWEAIREKYSDEHLNRGTITLELYCIPNATSSENGIYDFDKLCANFNIRYKLSHAQLLRSYKVIYIDKKAYYLFTYQLFEPSVRHIFDGNIPKNNNAAKILKFWNFSDEQLTDKLLSSKVQLLNRDISSVPEEDYPSSINDARLIYKNRVMVA